MLKEIFQAEGTWYQMEIRTYTKAGRALEMVTTMGKYI